ncbi:methyltransferase domain-containing protein [Streptomyces sp. NPDC059788]|uniref:methyltransferase domain-containing protein n=1 Tax=Streptomyces sp. NPDC059788 TaxID=3346948 RepID=UPI00365C66C4
MTGPDRLVAALEAKGVVLGDWRETVRTVRRELFLPDAIEIDAEVLSRRDDPQTWSAAVYDDVAITTQVNDGAPITGDEYRLPTSSTSMPSLMLEMLSLLDLKEGHRVLELGAGTGFNAAWLAHRLGDPHVVSVDVDPALVHQARINTGRAGVRPLIECADGDAGWPARAPYDRVIATYTVPEVPYAWVCQSPQGRIVTPWGGSFFSHSYAVLDVHDGCAQGRFAGYPAFMRTRNQRPPRGYLRDFLHHQEYAADTRTTLCPRSLISNADALFYTGLALPTVWYLPVDADDDSGETTVWLLADDRCSWAAADYVPGADDYLVSQYGPRRLWDEAEAAYQAWQDLGRPDRDRAGLSISPRGQYVWLDTPDHAITGRHGAPLTHSGWMR